MVQILAIDTERTQLVERLMQRVRDESSPNQARLSLNRSQAEELVNHYFKNRESIAPVSALEVRQLLGGSILFREDYLDVVAQVFNMVVLPPRLEAGGYMMASSLKGPPPEIYYARIGIPSAVAAILKNPRVRALAAEALFIALSPPAFSTVYQMEFNLFMTKPEFEEKRDISRKVWARWKEDYFTE